MSNCRKKVLTIFTKELIETDYRFFFSLLRLIARFQVEHKKTLFLYQREFLVSRCAAAAAGSSGEKKTLCRTAAARSLRFFRGIYFHVCCRFSRCCRSRIVRESIKVYFRGIACSLNRDLNFKRLLFKWRTRRDPSL